MSEADVDVFWRAVRAVNDGTWSDWFELAHPECVFIPQRAPVQGSYVGHDALRRFAQDTQETFDVFQVDYDDVRDLDHRVLALGTLRIRGKGSGIETAVPSAVLIEYEEGLMMRFQDFGDHARALAAAGLEA